MISQAPDLYTLLLPTQQAQQLLTHPAELDRLTHALEICSVPIGIVFAGEPMLRVVADPQSTEIKVLVEYSQAGNGDLHTTEVDGKLGGVRAIQAVGMMPKAFLIVNGLTTYPPHRTGDQYWPGSIQPGASGRPACVAPACPITSDPRTVRDL